ncbi:DNA cytosine methyltransferase [Nitrospina gracilis]|uniref:DNA cytosine methyltransferase n=1 Tax=Nitrospina gracilis TaxID=35801 RepID=UPI000A047931|nr:DNA cytosine methyltransferase [Nitrospina gracilis]
MDVLLSGSPCQGFSTLGKRHIDDPRNELLLLSGRIALKVKPKVFIVENVPGVLSGAHKKYWDTLQDMLREGGYQTTEIHCKGIEMGIAQTRVRIFLLAWKSRKNFNLIIRPSKRKVLKDVISNINGTINHNPKIIPKDSEQYLICKKIKAGQKLSNVRSGPRAVHTWDIPEVYGFTTIKEKTVLEAMLLIRRQRRVRDYGDADPIPVSLLHRQFGKQIIRSLEFKGYIRRLDKHYDLTNTFNGKFRRMSWDEPSNTVDTRFGESKYYLHPEEHRGFTIREAARIQGFPDTFIFEGGERDQYKMIGNAVPPPMSEGLAKIIKRQIIQ